MRSRFLPLGLALILALVVAFTVDNFVREVLIAPLLYASWLVVLVVRSLPTAVFWALFVLAAFVVAVRSFARPPRRPQGRSQRPISGQGPLASWYGRLQRAGQHTYSRWLLARDLRRLTGELLNPTNYFQLQEAESQRTDFEATLPPQIAAYFQAKMDEPQNQSRLRFWLNGRRHQSQTQLNLDPEIIVRYLEEQVTFQPQSSPPAEE